VSVSGGGLDLEDSLLNRQERDVERSSSKIENEHVLLADSLLVESVGDSGSGGLVDDTEDVHARDDTGVLGGLALGVVEVGGNGDDCEERKCELTYRGDWIARNERRRTGVGDGGSEVGLGGLLHLQQDHGRDLLRGELFSLSCKAASSISISCTSQGGSSIRTSVLDLDNRLGGLVDNRERPVCRKSQPLVSYSVTRSSEQDARFMSD
jgi:hypothetical protein